MMVTAASAVLRQNAQLRARLAAATARHSGNSDVESASAGVGSADPNALVPDVSMSRSGSGSAPVAGGAKPASQRRCRRAAAATTTTLSDADDDDDDDEGDDDDAAPADLAAAAYGTRTRHAPRRALAVAAHGGRGETVLALGDLVATPYGRGVVLTQTDADAAGGAGSSVNVLLSWGARASIAAGQVALLAVAGEQYTGPLAEDASLLPPTFAVTRASHLPRASPAPPRSE